jgi:hypothetical protein
MATAEPAASIERFQLRTALGVCRKLSGAGQQPQDGPEVQKAGIIIYVESYDAIGLIVQRPQSRAGTRVSLKLTEATQKPNAAAQVREWTDDTGKFKVRATLVQVADGKVTLRKEDGKEIVVSLARLSAADRDFLKQQEQGFRAR